MCEYAYYKEAFGGEMEQKEFLRFTKQAELFLAFITNQKSETAAEENKNALMLCCCALAERMREDFLRKGIRSESAGDYSVGYYEKDTGAKALYEIAALYLEGTGLLYRGCKGW